MYDTMKLFQSRQSGMRAGLKSEERYMTHNGSASGTITTILSPINLHSTPSV